MNVIHFTDLVKSGALATKRVFIRADLDVPQDASGAITDDTRIRASVGYISTGGDTFLEVLEGQTLPAFEISPKRAVG